MNVAELRERLQGMPAHWDVVVEEAADGSGGGADVNYLLTLDVQPGNFPTLGGMAVIVLKQTVAPWLPDMVRVREAPK